jgi:hypothetical protein
MEVTSSKLGQNPAMLDLDAGVFLLLLVIVKADGAPVARVVDAHAVAGEEELRRAHDKLGGAVTAGHGLVEEARVKVRVTLLGLRLVNLAGSG